MPLMARMRRSVEILLRPRAGRRTPPTRIVKKSDGVDYVADLLDPVGLERVRMTEARAAKDAGRPCFYIRHDVDWDLMRALDIAEVERRHGYRSTYFLLTPGSYGEKRNYYGTLEKGRIRHDPRLVDHCRRLNDLGHDIGFHNDLVSLSLVTGRPPADLLQDEVEFFAKHGIEVAGTAAHGNPLARELGYNNMEVFEEGRRKDREMGRTITHRGNSVVLHGLKLADFGFQYEAYKLPRDSRISESGGRWAGRVAGARVQDRMPEFDLDVLREICASASPANGVKAHSILTHPCHWKAA